MNPTALSYQYAHDHLVVLLVLTLFHLYNAILVCTRVRECCHELLALKEKEQALKASGG